MSPTIPTTSGDGQPAPPAAAPPSRSLPDLNAPPPAPAPVQPAASPLPDLNDPAPSRAQLDMANLAGVDPDEHARHLNAAARRGLSLAEVGAIERAGSADQKYRTFSDDQDHLLVDPRANDWLADPDNAIIARGDMAKLTDMERRIAAMLPERSWLDEGVAASVEGFRSLQAGWVHSAVAMGMLDADEAAEAVSRLKLQIQESAAGRSRRNRLYRENVENTSGLDMVGALLSDFEGLSVLSAENLAFSLPAVAGGVVGTATGFVSGLPAGPQAAALRAGIGGAVGTFTGGVLAEYGAWIDQQLSAAGYDLTKPEDIRRAYGNAPLMARLRNEATRKALTTATVDAFSSLLGGQLLTRAGRGVLRKTGAAAGELLVQSASEGLGEGAGQLAAHGQIDLDDVILESVVSGPQSSIEVAQGLFRLRGARQSARDLSRAADALVAQESVLGLAEAWRGSTTARRVPERAAKLIEVLARDASGEVLEAHFDRQTWDAFWEDQGKSPAVRAEAIFGQVEGRRRYQQSAATGQLVIPLDHFVSKLADEPAVLEQLVEHARFRPDGMTVAEVGAMLEQQAAEVKEAIDESTRVYQRRQELEKELDELDAELAALPANPTDPEDLTAEQAAAAQGLSPDQLEAVASAADDAASVAGDLNQAARTALDSLTESGVDTLPEAAGAELEALVEQAALDPAAFATAARATAQARRASQRASEIRVRRRELTAELEALDAERTSENAEHAEFEAHIREQLQAAQPNLPARDVALQAAFHRHTYENVASRYGITLDELRERAEVRFGTPETLPDLERPAGTEEAPAPTLDIPPEDLAGWRDEVIGNGADPESVDAAIADALAAGVDPRKSDDLYSLEQYLGAVEQEAAEEAEAASRPSPPTETVEPVPPRRDAKPKKPSKPKPPADSDANVKFTTARIVPTRAGVVAEVLDEDGNPAGEASTPASRSGPPRALDHLDLDWASVEGIEGNPLPTNPVERRLFQLWERVFRRLEALNTVEELTDEQLRYIDTYSGPAARAKQLLLTVESLFNALARNDSPARVRKLVGQLATRAKVPDDIIDEALGLLGFDREGDRAEIHDPVGPEPEAAPEETQAPSVPDEPDSASVTQNHADSRAEPPALTGSRIEQAFASFHGALSTALVAIARGAGGETVSLKTLQAAAERAFGGTAAEGAYNAQDLANLAEASVNRVLRELYAGSTLDEIMLAAGRLVAAMPTQTRRTEEKIAFQQFSTPQDYAAVAVSAAGVRPGETVLEPSAGNGNLLASPVLAQAGQLIANELDADRAALLSAVLGDQVTVFQEDAEQIDNVLPLEVAPDVVVMNPPFSAAGHRGVSRDLLVGSRHIEQALKRLRPGGRLVAIVGRGMTMEAPTFRKFWNRLQRGYTLRANLPVSGKVFQKLGTTFETRLLVIDHVGSSSQSPLTETLAPQAGETELAALARTLEPLRAQRAEQARPSRPERAEGARDPDRGPADATASDAGPRGPRAQPSRPGEAGDRGGAGADDPGARGPGEADAPDGGEDAGAPAAGPRGARAGGGSGRDAGAGGRDSEGAGRLPATPDEPDPARDLTPADSPGDDPVAVAFIEQATQASDTGADASLFEGYRPRVVPAGGGTPHPTPLVQSAAMASVDLPRLNAPLQMPDSALAALSDAQLETVAFANQAHAGVLPDGTTRRGFFVGDGTGVGKGREIAGIIASNREAGRRRSVWLSQNQKLYEDAVRDYTALGLPAEEVFNLGKVNAGSRIQQGDGVLFATYDALKSGAKFNPDGSMQPVKNRKARLAQIQEWLPKDFDGVIAFDESHNMGSALPMKGARGVKAASARALAGLHLQQLYPNARVVYVSATGATEVSNLAYAERLGLWGPGTPFGNVVDFVSKISEGGLAAMELVARDLKQLGLYTSRGLSMKGVKYERLEHALTPEQTDIYEVLADAWQVVQRNIERAVQMTDASPRARAAALSQFWSTNLRFFNQILTSMQMPTLLKAVRKDLDEGRSVVMQLTNHYAARLERAIADQVGKEAEGEATDLDISPRDDLIDLVKRGFPVEQFEDAVDEVGNKYKRMVTDSQGKPVLNRQAVELRDSMIVDLMDLRVPLGPVDLIMQEFGDEAVAEVTGRGKRVIFKDGEQIVETRNAAAANKAAITDFQNGTKRILMFSQAGATGASYHADLSAKNQQLRRHYVVQPGWVADQAIQGFGRTHRTNQAQPPEYILVSTDIPGHRRFVSSIARRIEQLGALTKGQRDAGASVFSERDNLEGPYSNGAVRALINDVVGDRIEGLDRQALSQELGLNLFDPETGKLIEQKIPPVTQFLNRILAARPVRQTLWFEAFSDRLDSIIERAVVTGTLDTGMQELQADGVRVQSETRVAQDEKTGAETHLVQLMATRRTERLDFDTLRSKVGSNNLKFYRNRKSGKTWAAGKPRSFTDSDGSVEVRVPLWAPNGRGPSVEQYALYSYDEISLEDGKEGWDAAYNELPETYDEPVTLLTGLLLPLWDRLPNRGQVYRVPLPDGRRIIGREVPKGEVQDTLKRLGVGQAKIDLSPAELGAALLERGATVTLSNGWVLSRVRRAGEQRIQVEGPTRFHLKALQDAGVFVEVHASKRSFYVPTGAAMQRALAAVTLGQDITNVQEATQRQYQNAPRRLNQGGGDEQGFTDFRPGDRGQPRRQFNVAFLQAADRTTYFHEMAHVYLEILGDLAESEGANEQLRSDWAAILRWLGISDRSQLTDAHHERWADAFERYLHEGKAPSKKLRRPFATFRGWMVAAYGALIGKGADLNDEVRGIMDRLIASDDEIAQAKSDAGMVPMPAIVLDAMSDAERIAYDKAHVDAEDETTRQVDREALVSVAERTRAAREEEMTKLRAEEGEAFDELPSSRAHAAIQAGRRKKVGLEPLVAAYGERSDEVATLRAAGLVEPGAGSTPTDLAAEFGAESPDSMVKGLMAQSRREDIVERRARQRLKAEFPELAGTRSIRAMARKAQAHEKRTRELLKQNQALRKLADKDRLARGEAQRRAAFSETERIAQLRAQATEILRTLPVGEIQPWRFFATLGRLQRRAADRVRIGKYDEAVTAHNQAMLNHELYRISLHIKDRMEATEARAAVLAGPRAQAKLGRLTPDGDTWRDQLNHQLRRFGFANIRQELDERLPLGAWLKTLEEDPELEAATPDVLPWLLDESAAVHWKKLTVDELNQVRDLLNNIYRMATTKDQLLYDQKRKTIKESAAELALHIRASWKGVKTRKRGERDKLARRIYNQHRAIDSIARRIDGGIEGVAWELLIRPKNEAASKEVELGRRINESLSKVYDLFTAEDWRQWDHHAAIEGVHEELSLQQRIMVALNWGNAEGRDRLFNDYTPDEVRAILATLQPRHAEAARLLWELEDSFWDESRELARVLKGVPPPKVEAIPFATQTADGTTVEWRGGYHRIKYEGSQTLDASEEAVAKMIRSGRSMRSTTKASSLHERKQHVGAPLRLDFGVVTSHLSETVHMLSHLLPLRDMQAILFRPEVQAAFEDTYGDSAYLEFIETYKDVARGTFAANDAAASFLGYLRAGTIVSFLGWRLTTNLINLGGITQSFVAVAGDDGPLDGTLRVTKAIGSLLSNPLRIMEKVRQVHELSTFMRNRFTTFQREAAEQSQRFRRPGRLNETRRSVTKWSFALLAATQAMVDLPTWLAAYGKALEIDPTDTARAIQVADQTVITAQGSGRTGDMARILRGSEWQKQFTTFMGFAARTMNLTAERTGNTDFKKADQVARLAAELMLIFFVPAVWSVVIQNVLRGDQDDDEGYAMQIARETSAYVAGQYFLVREAGGFLLGFGDDYDGTAGSAFIQKFLRAAGDFGDGMDRGFSEKHARSIIEASGILLHLPTSQILETYRGTRQAFESDGDLLNVLLGPSRRN